MIDTKELRRGNLLAAPNEHMSPIIKVEGIWEGTILCSSLDGTFTFKRSAEALEPIPITEDLLIKSGFIGKTSGEWRIVSETQIFIVERYEHTGSFYYTDGEGVLSGIGFEYIHQLANMYYLMTGEELNINL